MQSAIQIKVNWSSFTCIKCADKERFKNTTETELGKLAYRFQNAITLFIFEQNHNPFRTTSEFFKNWTKTERSKKNLFCTSLTFTTQC